MCTVSFVCSNDSIIITSNRDEKVLRPNAIPPKNYSLNGKNLIFPRDSKAGGTWFVVDEMGTVLVLLNGAEEKHEMATNYRKSRGLIVLDLIIATSPIDFWNAIDLENIEPFTLVLFQNNQLFQLRWNGFEKSKLELDIQKPHIWSSSTLYSLDIRVHRAKWFDEFLKFNNEISADKMMYFHQYTQEENEENGLVINRNDTLKTLSITQIVLEKNKVQFSYYDLINDQKFSNDFIQI